MAKVYKQAMGDVSGDYVLDVATGRGSSVGILERNLKGYKLIIGIDKISRFVQEANRTKSEVDILFMEMDAMNLGFRDQCFDIVFISNSLHHITSVFPVLDEMKRILKSGGKFIISEPHRDAAIESQLTNVNLHHWIADVDKSLGLFHARTFTRKSILEYVVKLDLSGVCIFDREFKEKNPFNQKTICRYEKSYLERYLQRAKESPDSGKLLSQGYDLKQRLLKVGIQTQEPLVVIVGEKR